MSWVGKKEHYEKIAHKIDPSIKLVTKDAWFWRAVGSLVAVFTFGGISKKQFLEEYATTIGPIQAYPRKWPKLSTPLLIHEARHTRQARWFGLMIHPWVGLPFFAVSYLLLPLPLGLAYLRYRFEIDAERESYKWMLRNGYSPEYVRDRAKRFGRKVCGSNYGWSWPSSSGFLKAAEKEIEAAKSK